MIVELLLLVVLIGINALFAASEIAFLSLNRNKVEKEAKNGNKKYIKIKKILENPSSFLSTIQIGITLAGFLASAFAAETFADYIVDKLSYLDISVAVLETVTLIVITLILSYFTLVFGELVPKRIAMAHSDKIAKLMANSINILAKVAYPFVWILTRSTNFVCRLFSVKEKDESKITEEDIKLMVAEGLSKGAIEKGEKELIDNIFKFNDTTIENIMTKREDIVAVDVNDSSQNIINIIRKEKYTRMPVYYDELDSIVGILNVKDIIVSYPSIKGKTLDIRDIMRNPYFVNYSDNIDDVFKDMQEKRIAMAIVMDKKKVVGVVTIEDMLEEIVGNILDEYDENNEFIQQQVDQSILIDGLTPIKDVEEVLGIEFGDTVYETLNGYLTSVLGHIPTNDDKEVITNGYCFEILNVEHHVMQKLRVEKVKDIEENVSSEKDIKENERK